jgi:hypothetical protein
MSDRSRCKTLVKLARDPRVAGISDEGENGIWIQLAPGFNAEGCSQVHADTVRDVVSDFRAFVEAGDPY